MLLAFEEELSILGIFFLVGEAAVRVPYKLRWSPARSRSSSVHPSIVERIESISKRFVSPRGVVRNDNKIFVTSRLDKLEIYLSSRV